MKNKPMFIKEYIDDGGYVHTIVIYEDHVQYGNIKFKTLKEALAKIMNEFGNIRKC